MYATKGKLLLVLNKKLPLRQWRRWTKFSLNNIMNILTADVEFSADYFGFGNVYLGVFDALYR